VKPVAIFQTAPEDGPAYFASYLEARAIPYRVVDLAGADSVPGDPRAFAGLGFMGGPMSVNDDLPWIAPALALVRAAVDAEVPVIGHCLGGQLMAKALGGAVTLNAAKEIGWGVVRVADNAAARLWFGDVREFLSFHWHGEAFAIPAGATRLASSTLCANQAFALGKHLGMQCHVEMTAEGIRTWYHGGAQEIRASAGPGVQQPEQMEEAIDARVRALQAIATRLYDRWTEGLVHD
jgi:GMP synthase-like glutamine amidotransferase